MKHQKRHIDGELYLSLETVAEVYELELVWLEGVRREGLLGDCPEQEERVWIAAARLERVAVLVRLCHGFGLDLRAAAAELGD